MEATSGSACCGGIGVVCGESDDVAVSTGGVANGMGLGTGLRPKYVPPACQQAEGVELALEPPTVQVYWASIRSAMPYSQARPVLGQYSILLAQKTWPAAFEALQRSAKSAPITFAAKWGRRRERGDDGSVTVGDPDRLAVLGDSAGSRYGRLAAQASSVTGYH